jgi:hypothetical protein
VRVLVVSEERWPSATVYPDENRIHVRDRPGSDPLNLVFDLDDARDD